MQDDYQISDEQGGQRTIIVQQVPKAPVNAGVTVLLATWGFLLLPVPGLSSGMAAVLGIATLVISIVCMVRGNVAAGIGLLLADLIGGPIFYLIGMALMLSIGASSL